VTIYKSRQINTDPVPMVSGNPPTHHPRYADCSPSCKFDPRPEFNATRDPLPVRNIHSKRPGDRKAAGWPLGAVHEWAPRPEFDNPVNPILVQLRGEHAIAGYGLADRARSMLSDLDRDWRADFTAEQIDHARRVLTRLANWSAS
jgi:hypothetical protein